MSTIFKSESGDSRSRLSNAVSGGGTWWSTRENTILKIDDSLKGLYAGIFGGLAGTMAMTGFQVLAAPLFRRARGAGDKEYRAEQFERNWEEGQLPQPATANAATAISSRIVGREFSGPAKDMGSKAVHYVFGAVAGGMYGALAEAMPLVTACTGTAFGTAVWLLGNEIAVPAFRLSKPPTRMPASSHIYSLASHLVYGMATEMARRAIRPRR